MTPGWALTPTSVDFTCVSLPKDHCVEVPWECINACEYNDHFLQSIPTQFNLWLTPAWPLQIWLPYGHSWAFLTSVWPADWPLSDLWPQQCTTLQSGVLLTKFGGHMVFLKQFDLWTTFGGVLFKNMLSLVGPSPTSIPQSMTKHIARQTDRQTNSFW